MVKSDKIGLVLNYINANRKGQEPITEEKAKRMYIAEERFEMERNFGKELVTEIFGEPTHLEKAESMLLEVEQGKLDRETKYIYMIDVSYQISDACGLALDSNDEVWEKYALLYNEIPITVMFCKKVPFSFSECKFEKTSISAKELEVAQNWLNSQGAEANLTKKVYIDYIFELVYISLKEILQEVKSEILGK